MCCWWSRRVGETAGQQGVQIGDGLHCAVHTGGDRGVFNGGIELVNLRLLGFDVVLVLSDVRLQLENLGREAGLVRGGAAFMSFSNWVIWALLLEMVVFIRSISSSACSICSWVLWVS